MNITNRIKRSLPHQRRQQLLHKQRQQSSRNDRQVEIVDLEQPVQLQRLPVAHHLASTQDDDVVRDERSESLVRARHGRGARREAEFLGLVASDFGKGGAEDGPEFEAEGALQGGKADFEP